MELVDMQVSKTCVLRDMRVRVSPAVFVKLLSGFAQNQSRARFRAPDRMIGRFPLPAFVNLFKFKQEFVSPAEVRRTKAGPGIYKLK